MKHFGDPKQSNKGMGIDMTPGVTPNIEPAPPHPPGIPGSGPPVNAIQFKRVMMERDVLLSALNPLPDSIREQLARISEMTDKQIMAEFE